MRQQFRPCVPEPWNIFQTYHNYDRPSRTRGTERSAEARAGASGHVYGVAYRAGPYGSTVFRERGGVQFDFEVEPTIVIGRRAHRVKAKKAYDCIAGYTIANDYTMHFGWWSELRKKSDAQDHIRRKNFPGYTPLSRTIVPKDLVGDPHDLAVRALGRRRAATGRANQCDALDGPRVDRIFIARHAPATGRSHLDRSTGRVAVPTRRQEGAARRSNL